MGAYDCDCINNLEYDRRERKQKEQSWSTASTAQSTAQSTNLIDRQATIDAVNNAFDRETLLARFVRSIAVRAIRDMPSVQPEPQEGHWIWVAGELMCSECRTIYSDLYPDYDNAVACPHCGAKMKGAEHETY